MLSLRKKNKAEASDQAPAWHPNFRNYQQLPDIKVVRTAFFVNGTAAFIALGLLVFVVLREIELRGINSNVELFDKRIAEDKPASTKAIQEYQKFKEQEKRVKDVEAFIKSKPVMSDIVLRFGETRPKNIALDMLEVRAPEGPNSGPPTILLRGTSRGAIEQAGNEVVGYVEMLRADAKLGPRLDPGPEGVRLVNQAPAGAEAVKFEITMKFKPAAAAAAAKK